VTSSTSPLDPSLLARAERHGVIPSYLGTDGKVRHASRESVVAVVEALEADDGETRDAGSIIDPVVVAWLGRASRISVRLPSSIDPRSVWVTLRREDGEEFRHRLSTLVTGSVRSSPSDEGRVNTYQLAIEFVFSATKLTEQLLPAGYHRLWIEGPTLRASSLLLAASRCPAASRGWGLFLALHGLRTGNDWGIGSYAGLGEVTRWVRSLGGSTVATLPLNPIFVDAADPSPYLPVSRLAYNELYVDLASLPEAASEEGRALLDSSSFRATVDDARRSVLVDYRLVSRMYHEALNVFSSALTSGPSNRQESFWRFVTENPHMIDYARFRATVERYGPGWNKWPSVPAVHRGSSPGSSESMSSRVSDPVVLRHLYGQWVADEQLAAVAASAGTGTGLLIDLPVGVHRWGFDCWFEPDAFVEALEVGAPPDHFFAEGQNWGCPPLHPERIRIAGYRYPIAVLRHALRYAKALRIDHVMGLHRLYCIPKGFDARDGVYVGYHADELHAIVAIEAARAGAIVVGEDLGTVPEVVRTEMTRDRMLRSWVLQFEIAPTDPLPDPPPDVVASLGTHDLPRFAAFWEGSDIDDDLAAGRIDPGDAEVARRQRTALRRTIASAIEAASGSEGPVIDDRVDDAAILEALRGCLRHLGESRASLVLCDLEDLWLERRRQNRPGLIAGMTNWRRRAARTLEAAQGDPEVLKTLRHLAIARSAEQRWS